MALILVLLYVVAKFGGCDLLGKLTPFDLPDHIQSEDLY